MDRAGPGTITGFGVGTRGSGRTAGGDAASSGDLPALPAAALVELTACQLDAGLPLAEAVGVLAGSGAGSAHPELARAAGALRLGLPWDTAWPGDGDLSPQMRDYRDALEFTAASATASAAVLRSQAELVRRAQYRRAERAAEALAVKLVLPLGLCFLPAFMCWGVVPVLMSLLPRAFGS
ncbi:type II secretion system protein [Kocuria tytonis]|uniref:Type II secretion system protein n=1 Tax=Kocuria tytonis TaxID=2054280 RepID=A0A495ACA3_9MICC|nr:type II secretion system protein [Kocuria tytonis]